VESSSRATPDSPPSATPRTGARTRASTTRCPRRGTGTWNAAAHGCQSAGPPTDLRNVLTPTSCRREWRVAGGAPIVFVGVAGALAVLFWVLEAVPYSSVRASNSGVFPFRL
jgi:ribosomal protein L37E